MDNLISLFPRRLLDKYHAYPKEAQDGAVRMLMANPDDLEAIELLELASDRDILPVKEEKETISDLLEKNDERKSDFDKTAVYLTEQMQQGGLGNARTGDPEDLKKSSESEPVVKMVNLIIDEAIRTEASDIHIEPQEDWVLIRNRVDGILRTTTDLPKFMAAAVTSRIKILADLDIAEKRVPQDGRIKRDFEGINIDLRVSTLPTHFGEKTVIRILRHTADLFSLENLGFSNQEIDYITEIINRPQGIIFVTGPTGSGKSSSLFAFLNKIRGKDINITTIENPIEIKLPRINQVQINEKAGLTFASTLRSILRQDPDVILIGEIRDKETAEIAVQAAQTGHLVFSTLHTNDAASAITRLRDLGVPPFLIASSIICVMAQRLVRKICSNCKTDYTPSDEVRFKFEHIFGQTEFPDSFFGKGCPKCNNTGFEGRIGIFEFLKLDTTIREKITADKSDLDIKKYAEDTGMQTVSGNGLDKVKAGVTSIEELLRVV